MKTKKKIPINFQEGSFISPLIPLGENTPVYRTRVRLFYKYENRNGSYISDAVAEQIIASAPATPVVGYFDAEKGDFTTHCSKELSKCYGFISETPNFAWEPHVDKDGLERIYACFDVILHCDYYPEANMIVGSNESMELNSNTLDGEWQIINDKEYYMFTNASLLGVCVLGKDVEPCFEGSAFFSKNNKNNYKQFSALLDELRKQVEELEGETKKMEQNDFQNEEVFEEQQVEETIETAEPEEKVEDEEFAKKAEEEEEEENPEDKKKEDEDEEEEAEMKKKGSDGRCSLSQEEADALAAANHELQESVNAFSAENEELKNKIAEQDAQFAELNNKVNELVDSLNAAKATIDAYEKAKDNEKKEQLFNLYENKISAEDMGAIVTLKEQASYEELETKLALCFARSSVVKDKQSNTEQHYVPHADPEESEFARIISKYKKKNK